MHKALTTWLPPALIAIACLFDLAPLRTTTGPRDARPPPSAAPVDEPPRPLTADETARLRKVRQVVTGGSEVGTLKVARIVDDRDDHPLVVVVEGRGHAITITVAPIGLLPFNPPVSTGHHALYYRGGPGGESAEAASVRNEALEAIAALVRKAE